MIEATRPNPISGNDTLVLAASICGIALVGLLIVRELRVAPAAFATAAAQSIASNVPVESVSVPALQLGAAGELKVGESIARAQSHLIAASLVRRDLESGPLGARDVRSYRFEETRFVVLFEPFERHGEPRVSAIYLQ